MRKVADLTNFTDSVKVLSINQPIGGDAMKAENKIKGSWRNIVSLPISTANVIAGEQWYIEANHIATTIGHLAGYVDFKATSVGAGILAALSPRREWDLNVSQAILLVTEGTKKHFQVQHDKALAILAGKDPVKVLGDKARKTQAFYLAILYPNNDWSPVVIDRHASAIYKGEVISEKDLKHLDSTKVYSRIENAYMKGSRVTGMNHHVLQAMTWGQWRENKRQSW